MRTASSGTRRGSAGPGGGRDGQLEGPLGLGARRAHRSGPADGPDDLLDESPVAEAGRQLRLRVAVGGDVGHRGQDRDLVLAPGRLVGPGPLALAPDLEPAAVDLDHRQGRPRLDPRLQRAGLESAHLLIPRRPATAGRPRWAMRPSCRPLMVTSARSATASAASRKEGSRAAERTILPSTEGL